MKRPLNYLSKLVEAIPTKEDEHIYIVCNHSLCNIVYGDDPSQTLPKQSGCHMKIDELVLLASTPEINFQFYNGNVSVVPTKDGLKYIFKADPNIKPL